MKKILIAFLTYFPIAAFALELQPGQTATVEQVVPDTTVTATVPEQVLSIPVPGRTLATEVSCVFCPPPLPPIEIPVVVPMPGNAHAVSHPAQAQALGYAKCQECHAPTSATPAKVGASGSFLCSQYDFCTSGNKAGPSSCKVGVTFPHPVTGALVSDPVSKAPVTSGKTVGGYAPGSTPFCRDCHYPHATAGYKEPPKSQIHVGCLDCHTAVGSSKLKPGIKD